jgi:hypothetical protein
LAPRWMRRGWEARSSTREPDRLWRSTPHHRTSRPRRLLPWSGRRGFSLLHPIHTPTRSCAPHPSAPATAPPSAPATAPPSAPVTASRPPQSPPPVHPSHRPPVRRSDRCTDRTLTPHSRPAQPTVSEKTDPDRVAKLRIVSVISGSCRYYSDGVGILRCAPRRHSRIRWSCILIPNASHHAEISSHSP